MIYDYDGKRIAELREARGLSMAKLAKNVGISQPSLHSIEHQRTKNPRAKTLMGIANALGVPLKDILKAPKGGSKNGVDIEQQIVAIARAMSAQDRQTWLIVGETLLKRK